MQEIKYRKDKIVQKINVLNRNGQDDRDEMMFQGLVLGGEVLLACSHHDLMTVPYKTPILLDSILT